MCYTSILSIELSLVRKLSALLIKQFSLRSLDALRMCRVETTLHIYVRHERKEPRAVWLKSICMHNSSDQSAVHRHTRDVSYALCLICLADGGHNPLVTCPKQSSLPKLLECVWIRGNYGDWNYPEISRGLKNLDSTTFASVFFLRRCCQETIKSKWYCQSHKMAWTTRLSEVSRLYSS